MIKNNLLKIIDKNKGYFHDGSIRAVTYEENKLIISIESAEIIPEWPWDRKNMPLSIRNTVTGKMHFEKVKSIKEDGISIQHVLQVIYDRGEILDLKLEKNKFYFFVCWKSYTQNLQTDVIEIEAENIYWEHIPTLFDAFWNEP